MANWIVSAIRSDNYILRAYNKKFICKIGLNGFVNKHKKKEGDLKTPIGKWKIKSIFYRHDKLSLQKAIQKKRLKLNIISKKCIWCDDPTSSYYNKYVSINNFVNSFEQSHEKLWRQDNTYDLIIEINYNQKPIIAGKGSAIFIHCNSKDALSTKGCISLDKKDLIFLINKLKRNDYLIIK